MGCRGRTEMSLVSHRSTPLLYIHKKLRIALRHERFRNAPNIRNPAPRQLLCAFAWRIPHVWRSENVCKCSCEHGICSRFPRCFLHIRQEAAVLDISVSAAVFFYGKAGDGPFVSILPFEQTGGRKQKDRPLFHAQ